MKRTLIAAFLALAGCGPQNPLAGYEHAQMVRKSELGDKWPFTVDSVIVHCEKGIYYLVTVPGGETYALNGTATSTHQYKEIEAIWLHDAKLGGNWRIGIDPILLIADKNCHNK
jgi:hypothetical protein